MAYETTVIKKRKEDTTERVYYKIPHRVELEEEFGTYQKDETKAVKNG